MLKMHGNAERHGQKVGSDPMIKWPTQEQPCLNRRQSALDQLHNDPNADTEQTCASRAKFVFAL